MKKKLIILFIFCISALFVGYSSAKNNTSDDSEKVSTKFTIVSIEVEGEEFFSQIVKGTYNLEETYYQKGNRIRIFNNGFVNGGIFGVCEEPALESPCHDVIESYASIIRIVNDNGFQEFEIIDHDKVCLYATGFCDNKQIFRESTSL